MFEDCEVESLLLALCSQMEKTTAVIGFTAELKIKKKKKD